MTDSLARTKRQETRHACQSDATDAASVRIDATDLEDGQAGNVTWRQLRRQTHDADEHAACLTNWQQRYDQLSAGRFDGLFEEFCFGRVQIFRESLNQSVHQRGIAWPGSRTFAVPVVIDGTGRFSGKVFDSDSILTLPGACEFDFRTPRRLEYLACTVDAEAFHTCAAHLQSDFGVDLESHVLIVPTNPQKVSALRSLLSAMISTLQIAPALLEHASMRKAMEQGLFESLISASNVDAAKPEAAPSLQTRHHVFTKAREYMEAHIEEPISIVDLCIKLGVSRRTLQYTFEDMTNINPVRYLRALRLNAVRRELMHARGDGSITVADVAARWGFWHLSYFASQYKAMFDELPSVTLSGKAPAIHPNSERK